MNKKHIVFIILLTVAAMLIWILGEITLTFLLNLGAKASIVWTVIMLAATLGLSVWRCCRDESGKNSRKW
ncbi:hypothetical protein [Porcipelethomonas sp.]|uniref:hypothetical protein n=1 Tax=Porcipelethomonas sp. TaxID=2981675 RepID=UPI003EF8BA57